VSSVRKQGAAPILPYAAFAEMPQALRLRLYKVMLDRLGPGQVLTSTLMALDQAQSAKQTGKTFQFPENKTVTISRSGLVFGLGQAEFKSRTTK
jgi:tRNA(Ile)-lysidine synthase